MKNLKGIIAMGLAACMLATLLMGCGGTAQPQPGNDTQNTDTGITPMTFVLGHVGANSEVNLLQRFALKFKEEVESRSNGSLAIEIHPAAELGGERDLVEGIQLGTLDMALTSSNVLGNFVSDVYAFDFPFLFTDEEHASRVFDGEIGQDMRQRVVDASGINVLVWPSNGARQMINSVRPITCAADIKGVKIRTAENKLHMALFSALGGDPTPMGTPELYTSLQQGVVDGMEGTLTWIVPAKYYEVTPYVSMTNHLYAPSILAVNDNSFQSLSEDVQKILQESAEVARDYQRDYVTNANEDMIAELEAYGCQVVREEEIDRESFVTATQKVYDDLGGEYNEILTAIKDLQ